MTPLSGDEFDLLQALEIADGAEDALDFVPRGTPQWERPTHLRPLAEIFARAEFEPVRALSSVPPQHGKSQSIFHFMVRYMQHHPERTNAYLTYAGDFAEEQGRHILDVAERAGLIIRRDGRKIGNWHTPSGGGLVVTSLDGQITGKPFSGFIVVDDPHRSELEARSVVSRSGVIKGFKLNVMTRVHPTTSVLVNGTRWHVDDLIGTLKREGGWTHVNMPAINERGEALWPTQRPLWFLKQQRPGFTNNQWAALYMGDPQVEGTEVFHEPVRYEKPDVVDAVIVIALDPAATAKTSADYSAIVVGAGKYKRPHNDDPAHPGEPMINMDILDVRRLQVEFTGLVQQLLTLQAGWGGPIVIEAVAGFKGVAQAIRHVAPHIRVIEIAPIGDKYTRAMPYAAAWNSGRVRVPPAARAPWVEDFVNEHRRFGVGADHDDQVDAGAHLFNALSKMTPRHPRVGPSEPPRLTWG